MSGVSKPRARGLTRRVLLPVTAGFLTLALAFGGFGYWAVTMPIAGAAVTEGKVGPENSRQTVQHLEGGVVRAIQVRDGDTVEAGDTLVILDDTKARAQLEAQRVVHEALEVRQHRLMRELDVYAKRSLPAKPRLPLPDSLVDGAGKRAGTAELVRVEQERFVSRIEALDSALDILDQTIEGYREEIEGLRIEIEAIERQLAFQREEFALYSKLRKRRLEVQSKVLQAQRSIAQSEQLLAERRSRIVKLTSAIKTDTLKRTDLWVGRIDETAAELTSVSQELLTSQQSLRSYRDTLDRTVIRAPVDGALISLGVNTVGGVLAAGATVVEIVPSRDALTIEAQVQPNDIDIVAVGQSASVSLLAYPQRNLPRIHGAVTSVSPDSLTNAEGDSYYIAKIELAQSEIERLGKDIRVVPGMSVQAMITTKPRTFLDYVIAPVLESARRAFKEP